MMNIAFHTHHGPTGPTKEDDMSPMTLMKAAVTLAVLNVATALAAAPLQKTQAPGYSRLMLGQFEVTALSDGTIDLPVDQLLSQPPLKTARALELAFLTAPLETSGNAYLINTGSRLVLVDTGAGALFGPTLGKLVANLRAAGYRPEDVDDVLITHLHPDHVGGLASGGLRTFPNATVHADQRESDYWLSQANLDAAPESAKGFFQGAMASLGPTVAAGAYHPFTGNTEVVPGIRSLSSFGHTAGHTAYLVESGDQRLVLLGDVLHVPAVQLDNPAITIGYDTDPKAATEARRRLLTQVAKDGTLVALAHLPFPGLGHFRATGKAYQWVPMNYLRLR
jgi:glyoxylase-like metal-dependent hydrolase (beta-lactamase superfamily II)